MGYLWLTPTGNIKPGGFEYPLALMIIGSLASIYILINSKKEWAIYKKAIQATNIALSGSFIGLHIVILAIVGINMVLK